MNDPYQVLKGKDADKSDFDYDEYYYMMFTLVVLKNAHVVVETGLGFGGSTRIWLEALSVLPDPELRELHTYDIGEQLYAETPAKIRSLDYPAKWYLHVQDSRQKEKDLLPRSIDILYLDSDHQYSTVKAELDSFEPYLSPDAVILTHDSCPAHEHSSFTHGTGKPSDTYFAMDDWGKSRGYKSLLYPHPNGMTLLFRCGALSGSSLGSRCRSTPPGAC